jgi:hypothetical protein
MKEGFSPYYRELLVYVGQKEVYGQGAELIEKLLRIRGNSMQLHRLTNKYGEEVSTVLAEESPQEESDRVYAMLDGGMVLTREEGWKEVKIGRVFTEGSNVAECGTRNWIRHSEYAAHLGTHEDFEVKMSVLTDKYEGLGKELVFINDGAKWIWNWVGAAYPKATQILDYYHAKEYLSRFSRLYWTKKTEHQDWLRTNGEVLRTKGVETLMDIIERLPKKTKTVEVERVRLLRYCKNNQHRMDYPDYLRRGLLIGSGAIEAAHRTVSQKRLKLSGQRWTEQGAQNVLNLRVLQLSGKWTGLQDMLRAA